MERAAPGSRRRRRALAGHLLRSLASVAVLTALYYLAPLDRGLGVGAVMVFVLGLLLFGCLTAWQIAAITRAEYPRLRALEALATAVPLFLVLFSATYYLLADSRPASFSEPLTRTDALYFTVTVFATVGFGDIAPTTGTSRALTTVQMLADLVVVGVIAKVLFGAVQVGLRRRGLDPERPEYLDDP
ncbi:potassium channel family protein [Streptomyces crystallinus]|uniref:Potassium channel domain-containing protein n=1 Tax=Streptomyces crystallinus TaxID=68191 RepID=A0ABN1FSJ6_9ACTN